MEKKELRPPTKGEILVEKALAEHMAAVTPESIHDNIDWSSAEVIDVVGKAIDRLLNYNIEAETLHNIVYSVCLSSKIGTIMQMLRDENGCQVPTLKMNVGRKYGIEPEDMMSTFLALILLNHTKEDVYQ